MSSTPVAASASTGFRKDLEGLRGIAFMVVLVDHVWHKPPGGFASLDLFFVVSGFLITAQVWRELQRTGKVSLKGFYIRRIRRLLPAAVLVLILTDLAAKWLLAPVQARNTLHDSWWAAGFLANWHYARTDTDYFQRTSAPSVFQHYWSLSVEEQFYLIWPFLVILAGLIAAKILHGRRRTALASVSVVVAAISFTYAVTSFVEPTSYFSTPMRGWEFAIGGLTAIFLPELRRIPPALKGLMHWVALGALIWIIVGFDSVTHFPGPWTMVPVLATCFMMIDGAPRWSPMGPWLMASSPAGFIGQAIYSLYLVHFPIVIISYQLWGNTLRIQWFAFGLSIVVGYALFYLFEQPIRKSNWLLGTKETRLRSAHSKRFGKSDHLLTGPVLAALSVVVVTMLVILGTRGSAPQVATSALAESPASAQQDKPLTGVDALHQQLAAALQATKFPALDPSLSSLPDSLAPEMMEPACQLMKTSDTPACIFGDATAKHSVAVVGDSLALSYMPALRIVMPPTEFKIHTLTELGCPFADLPPSIRSDASRCAAARDAEILRAQTLKPDLVILVEGTPGKNDSGFDPNFTATHRRDAVATAIARYQATAKFVVLIAQPPQSGNLQTCVTRGAVPADCTTSINAEINAVEAASAAAAQLRKVAFIRVADWFCIEGRCPPFVGNLPIYADGTHLTAKFSRTLAPLFDAAFKPVLLRL